MKMINQFFTVRATTLVVLFFLFSSTVNAQEIAPQDSTARLTAVQDSTIQEKPAKKEKKKQDAFKVFAGATSSSLNVEPEKYESNPQLGYLLGFSYKRGRFFYYEFGARFNKSIYESADLQGGKALTTSSNTFSVAAIDIPLALGINFTSFTDRLVGVRVFGGVVPSFTIGVGDNSIGITKDDINSFNFYGQGGVGLDVAFLFVEAGINYGFGDLLINDIQSNPQQFFVNLGFRF